MNPRDAGFEIDAVGRLVYITPDGARHERVEAVRAFPLSEPQRWISIVDHLGRELLLIEDLNELRDRPRSIILAELSSREFVPRIERVVRITGEVPACEWIVETDRGRAEFTVAEEDHIRRLRPRGVLIVDNHGVRYRIDDVEKLDPGSQRALEPFV